MANQNTQHQVKIHSLEAEKAELTDRNEENKSHIQTLIQAHENESERLQTAKSGLDKQINDLHEAVRTIHLENNNFADQIEELIGKNQQLVTETEDQSHRKQQQPLDKIAQ